MTPRWLLRYQSRLDVIAMRLAYASEDKRCADYWVPDEDGTLRVYSLIPARLEWWMQMEWERTEGNPAVSPELD